MNGCFGLTFCPQHCEESSWELSNKVCVLACRRKARTAQVKASPRFLLFFFLKAARSKQETDKLYGSKPPRRKSPPPPLQKAAKVRSQQWRRPFWNPSVERYVCLKGAEQILSEPLRLRTNGFCVIRFPDGKDRSPTCGASKGTGQKACKRPAAAAGGRNLPAPACKKGKNQERPSAAFGPACRGR